MATKTDMTVANTIRDHLGHKCLYMLGAKNLIGSTGSLSFRIGGNDKGVNAVRITLNPMDLYDVAFYKIRGSKVATLSEREGVYAEDLHAVIESETGMRTSL
jgi:hypothetical protein